MQNFIGLDARLSMKRLIYIISAEFSGSTALDMLISTYPGFVGMGEVAQTLNHLAHHGDYKRNCSCEEAVGACPMWSAMLPKLRVHAPSEIGVKYDILDSELCRRYGNDYSLIDSSKRLDVLESHLRQYGDRLHVIFLVRDIRGYLFSQLSKGNRRTRLRRQRGGFLLGRAPVWFGEIYNWTIRTLRIYFFLKRHRVPHLRVGYDDLGLNRHAVAWHISDFTGMGNVLPDFSFAGRDHHMVRGNKFVIMRAPAGGFSYDDSWTKQSLPLACRVIVAALLPLSNRLVYRRERGLELS